MHAETGVCQRLMGSEEACQVTKFFTRSLTLHYAIPQYGKYFVDVVICPPPAATAAPVAISWNAVLMNPGKNHLSSSLIPAAPMYKTVGWLWIIITGAYLGFLKYHWHHAHMLYKVVIAYPIIKVTHPLPSPLVPTEPIRNCESYLPITPTNFSSSLLIHLLFLFIIHFHSFQSNMLLCRLHLHSTLRIVLTIMHRKGALPCLCGCFIGCSIFFCGYVFLMINNNNKR